jgi:hypothetical protein
MHVWHSLDKPPALHSNVTTLGAATPAPADAGLNLDDKG